MLDSLKRLIPRSLRARCGDWLTGAAVGVGPGLVLRRKAKLDVSLDWVIGDYLVDHDKVRFLQVGRQRRGHARSAVSARWRSTDWKGFSWSP